MASHCHRSLATVLQVDTLVRAVLSPHCRSRSASNKFYHKINYLYTIAELERQFPHNRLSIPVTIEQ